MANVLPSIDFYPRPVSHAPSQFGFGFGLGGSVAVAPAWQSSITPTSTFHQFSSFNQPSPARVQKRRHDDDDQSLSRDHSMDRSPTPERVKRAAPKRARVAPLMDSGSRDDKDAKENKAPGGADDNDVDVGVLLASLPSQSLLPLLTSLLSAQPSLKSLILPLIPRPSIETAIHALGLSARKLRDAYPYSNPPPSQPLSPATTGFGFGSSRPAFSAFGRPPPPQPQSAFSQSSGGSGGMRDSYIQSRLRQPTLDFVAACMSYMPYFSYVPNATTQSMSAAPTAQSHSTTLQSVHREHSSPSETYKFLAALTEHIFSQPPLAQALLSPHLLPRLSQEWKAWVHKLDASVNREGKMFPEDTVRTWERGLDAFAEAHGAEGVGEMRSVRDLWISKVGWLVGRQPMEVL
ncbi:hypothetical protein B0H15DRAFT_224452 [Mycena belliarum]|uniref:Tethering factor for nuclear proteasome STS1 n=1 Tax=Mycena belliarum TaxID=1033014 RepID=A0AAD6UIU1_9AGAR|nr:hypothetical protein B0H15DRAFT_224452 [Mycena belliae]